MFLFSFFFLRKQIEQKYYIIKIYYIYDECRHFLVLMKRKKFKKKIKKINKRRF